MPQIRSKNTLASFSLMKGDSTRVKVCSLNLLLNVMQPQAVVNGMW